MNSGRIEDATKVQTVPEALQGPVAPASGRVVRFCKLNLFFLLQAEEIGESPVDLSVLPLGAVLYRSHLALGLALSFEPDVFDLSWDCAVCISFPRKTDSASTLRNASKSLLSSVSAHCEESFSDENSLRCDNLL